MSIRRYTNFENIDKRKENEGKYITEKDFTVISKNQFEDVDFGECGTDVMEVSVYDINNNLLPQLNGQTTTYIRSGDIKNYLYKISRPNKALANGKAQVEIAIDAERLLNDIGFENGILRLNINFVRTKVGTEDKVRRVWIQEISPSRQEVRIVPLKTNNKYFDDINAKELESLKNLNKDFKYYKKSILDSINKFENTFLEKIDDIIKTKYGQEFFDLARKDFGLMGFSEIKKSIYNNFRDSVVNYLSNRAYDISQSNFGLSTKIRFIDCEQYEFGPITAEIQNILNNCVRYNLQFLKRRDLDVRNIPQEFKAIDLTPDLENISKVAPPKDEITVVYDTTKFKIEKPINSDKQIVRVFPEKPKDIQPPIIIDEVPVITTNTFTYHIQNKDSRSSAVFTFFDATGASVEKILAPGSSTKICAKENTVSAATYREKRKPNTIKNRFPFTSLPRPSGNNTNPLSRTAIDRLFEGDDMMNFIIKKEQPCSKLQVGSTAPTPTSGYVGGYASTPVSGYSTTRPTTTINPQPTQTIKL